MNYYEELAVSPNASTEEIRDAYRQLARLLHPDRSLDERSRRLAETQMKRLNAIVEVLTNADKRQQYDFGLRQQITSLAVVSQPVCVAAPRWNLDLILDRIRDYRHPNNAWIVACSTVVLALFWSFRDSFSYSRNPTPLAVGPALSSSAASSFAARSGDRTADSGEQILPTRERTRPPTQPAKALEYLEGQIHYWRRHSEQMRGERDAAVGQVRRLEASLSEAMARAAPVSAPMVCPVSPSAIPPAIPPVAPHIEQVVPEAARAAPVTVRPAKHSLAGVWYYVRSPRSGNMREDLYPPEFIEAVVVEESGGLRGRYRARYRISDRAISPNVVFQFKGRAAAEQAQLPWAGPGGAKGEVRLRLLNPNSLEVAWIASELGATQGLGSGTATLVRRHEP